MDTLLKLISECCGTCASKAEMLQEVKKLIAENNQLAQELAATEQQRLNDVISFQKDLDAANNRIKELELANELQRELGAPMSIKELNSIIDGTTIHGNHHK